MDTSLRDQLQLTVSNVMEEKKQHDPLNQLNDQLNSYKLIINMGLNLKNPKTVTQTNRIENQDQDIFCVKFDPRDNLVASGSNDGYVFINSISGKLLHKLNVSPHELCPTTCLRYLSDYNIFRWRPTVYSQIGKSVIVTGNSDGTITHWHAPSGKILNKIEEKDNHVLTIDYNKEGTQFASAGKDCSIRVYDEATKSIVQHLGAGTWNQNGHNNRIFSLKYLNDDNNVIITGGWDNTVYIWDLRQDRSVGSIYGPNISGDSMDYSQGQILTGSYRNKDQLQLWDLRERKLIQDIEWEQGDVNDRVYLYSAQFGKVNSNYICAGSTGQNQLKIFDRNDECKTVASVFGISKGVYSLDFGNVSDKVAFTGGTGVVYTVDIK